MSEALKIGDSLWTSPYGRPEKWEPKAIQITGETKFSWLVGEQLGSKDTRYKVNKKTLQEAIPNMLPRQWYTEQGKADLAFIRQHRHAIVSWVQVCDDVEKLRQIGNLVGYNIEESP